MKQRHEHDRRGRPDRCGERHMDEDDPPGELRLPLQLPHGGLRQSERGDQPDSEQARRAWPAELPGTRGRTGGEAEESRRPHVDPHRVVEHPEAPHVRVAGMRPGSRRDVPVTTRASSGEHEACSPQLLPAPGHRARGFHASRSTISAPARATSASVKCTTTAMGSSSVSITTRPMGAWTSVKRRSRGRRAGRSAKPLGATRTTSGM